MNFSKKKKIELKAYGSIYLSMFNIEVKSFAS